MKNRIDSIFASNCGSRGFSVTIVLACLAGAMTLASCKSTNTPAGMFDSQTTRLEQAFKECRGTGITEQELIDASVRFDGEKNMYGAFLCLVDAFEIVMKRAEKVSTDGVALINAATAQDGQVTDDAMDKLDAINNRMEETNKQMESLVAMMRKYTAYQLALCVQPDPAAHMLCRLPEVLASPGSDYTEAFQVLRTECATDAKCLEILKLFEAWLKARAG